jgi:tRNA pseudouridine55 synthase
MTSHDAVDAVRRALHTRKVGHAGTLDPMATGLLVMGVGRATRFLRFLGDLLKTYEGTARLGTETTTLDAEGDVVRTHPVAVDGARVEEMMRAFLGEQMQRPPAFSAVKVGGRKSYEAARAGVTLDVSPRRVRVDRFALAGFDPPDLDFFVTCSGGTYVRVLLADLGASLGCGAHLTRLRRTRVGGFDVREAVPPHGVERLLPLESAVAHLPTLSLVPDEAAAARHGSILAPAGIAGPYAVRDPGGRLIGVYEDEASRARPQVILAPAVGRP